MARPTICSRDAHPNPLQPQDMVALESVVSEGGHAAAQGDAAKFTAQ